MHEAVKRSAEAHGAGWPHGGYAWLYDEVADLLSAPDLTVANLETPIAPVAGTAVQPYVFNAPPEAAAALAHAGVDLVTVANNHAFDQGRAGFLETLQRVERAGLGVLGAGPSEAPQGPVVREVDGLTVAFLAWARFFNQDGNDCPAAGPRPCLLAARLDPEAAVEAVRLAAGAADAVVVVLHWGDEYQPQPRAADVELAHRLCDAGAVAVIGHHPHVLQPVELYPRADGGTSVIAYSLGNFVSNQSRRYVHGVTPPQVGATRDGALLTLELVRRDYGRGVARVELGRVEVLPLWTENDTAAFDASSEPSRRPRIRVVAMDRALAEAAAALAAFPDPVPAERRREWVRLRARAELLAARRAAAMGVLGEDLARRLGPEELAAPRGPAPAPLRASRP
jgi:poly-gamma-glutamate synthesis protein (capsule biosynthesis protein)